MNAARFLVCGLKAKLPEKLEPYIERVSATCAITGDRITEGIQWRRAIPKSTSEYLDLLNGATSKYISIDAATAFAASWNLGSRLIFENGDAYHPLISSASAQKSSRVCWRDIIRKIWPQRRGQQCLIIVAGDFKKRVWPRARVGPLGEYTPVFLLDPVRHIACNVFVNWPRLIKTLDLIEDIYTIGFNKNAIAEGLYMQYEQFEKAPTATLEYEKQLKQYRSVDEFSIALLVAQKRNAQ